MAALHVSAPEGRSDAGQPPVDQPGPGSASRSPRRSSAPSSGPVQGRPRPRTRPPSFKAPPPAQVYPSQSLWERLLPPLFFGFLFLAVLGSAAVLLWTPSTENEYALTSEELRILEGTASATPTESTPRTRPARAASEAAMSGSAGLRVETTVPGAIVSIDGEVAGVTPFQQRGMPSRWHIVSLERPGFGTQDTLVFLEDEALTSISVVLRPVENAIVAEDAPSEDRFAEEVPTPSTAPPPASSSPTERPPETPPNAPATGSISVAVNPAGVPVQLDGRTVGVAPMELSDVAPGPHRLTFFLPGYETATVSVDVRAGANEVVDIALVPQTGTLVVVARPWGSIYVNGELQARDTDVSVEVTLPVGSHQVRVEHPSLGVQERTVEVQPERTTIATIDLN